MRLTELANVEMINHSIGADIADAERILELIQRIDCFIAESCFGVQRFDYYYNIFIIIFSFSASLKDGCSEWFCSFVFYIDRATVVKTNILLCRPLLELP